ncbi:hypothetical protein [Crucian carp herpesvirus]|uniref:ORF52 n=1 Tax=Cyprinid herpesvirus 2 TaxID=317878 RepID=K7PBN8_CYHV2|nr:protein ORF52 [Cyprinid herpesvirus 2]AFJ20486.1 protein ORF52 [Cyprinid herpesvirus 2]AKC02001.1 hypothetical protein [Cyprinid herpesvirus 2]AMB21623.1 ORF52 [Cyprinid herpesvirus 2]APB92902.1 hypothetical protein [Crucian carp herpesvirus]
MKLFVTTTLLLLLSAAQAQAQESGDGGLIEINDLIDEVPFGHPATQPTQPPAKVTEKPVVEEDPTTPGAAEETSPEPDNTVEPTAEETTPDPTTEAEATSEPATDEETTSDPEETTPESIDGTTKEMDTVLDKQIADIVRKFMLNYIQEFSGMLTELSKLKNQQQ